MQIAIIRPDNFVSIDGEGYRVDVSELDTSIHAIQWNGIDGEIEKIDPISKKMISNEHITSFTEYSWVIDLWNIAKSDYIEETTPKFKENV